MFRIVSCVQRHQIGVRLRSLNNQSTLIVGANGLYQTGQHCKHFSWGSLMHKLNPFSSSGLVTDKISNLSDNYEVLDEIGCGRFGKVRRVRLLDTDGPEVIRAAKTISKEGLDDVYDLKNEIAILEKMDHIHCMGLIETIEDEKDIHIISNLCTGGELFDVIIDRGYFSERDAARYVRQILLALEYCHNLGIVHRDIKPENLLMYTDDLNAPLCLCDFGMSRFFKQGERLHASCGSPSYVAPEVLENCYTEKCDIWSVGVICYILLSGKVPFGGRSDSEIMKNVSIGVFNFEIDAFDEVSDSAKDFIRKLLEIDLDKRLSATEALEHEWIRELAENRDMPLRKALQNIKKFSSHVKLKRKSLEVIARHLATSGKDQRDMYTIKLRELFCELDKEDTGFVLAEDLARAILDDSYKINSFNTLVSAEELAEVLRGADTDENGLIDINEFFAAALTESIYLQEANLHFAFRYFDKDCSGSITLDELRDAYGPSSESDLRALEEEFDRYDLNSDGVIDYEEFVEHMQRAKSANFPTREE